MACLILGLPTDILYRILFIVGIEGMLLMRQVMEMKSHFCVLLTEFILV